MACRDAISIYEFDDYRSEQTAPVNAKGVFPASDYAGSCTLR